MCCLHGVPCSQSKLLSTLLSEASLLHSSTPERKRSVTPTLLYSQKKVKRHSYTPLLLEESEASLLHFYLLTHTTATSPLSKVKIFIFTLSTIIKLSSLPVHHSKFTRQQQCRSMQPCIKLVFNTIQVSSQKSSIPVQSESSSQIQHPQSPSFA